jgi:hypothetical protein
VMAVTGQRHVVVVGMHRSGTSAMASALARLGLALPDETDLITPGPANERGYWELRRFVTFNDGVLKYLNGSWSTPPKPAPGWELSRDQALVELRSGARDFILREFRDPHMVLKDPRLCITLPFWRQVFDHDPVAVLVLRDPLDVARSLRARNNFPLSLGLALWRRYVQESIRSVDGLPVFVAQYEKFLADPRAQIGELTAFLRAHDVVAASEERVEHAVEAFEPELRHHRSEPQEGRAAAAMSSLTLEQNEFLTLLQQQPPAQQRWSIPAVPEEPPWVDDVIELVVDAQMVVFAHAVAKADLKWIMRSRLFGATRLFWRVTSSGPRLSPDDVDGETAVKNGDTTTVNGDTTTENGPVAALSSAERLGAWRDSAKRIIDKRRVSASNNDHFEQQGNPIQPQQLDDFRVFAVIKSWMDEDIIEATVRNALIQGAERVFLVDNASSDATVANAEAAGATVAEIYQSEAFDGRLVQPLVNAVVARESLRSGSEHVWWMLLDSDEFPEGPDGLTVREYLAGLDKRFRIAGASFMNHVPDHKPEYVPGFHPLDFQPLYYPFEPLNHPPCPLGHWKHPLQRFDRHGQFIASNDGSHLAFASERLIEPSVGIVIHHFQYRDEARTRARLQLIHETRRDELHSSAGWNSFERRRRSLEGVYSQRWDQVEVPPNRRSEASRHPQPWPRAASAKRWYPKEDDTTPETGSSAQVHDLTE